MQDRQIVLLVVGVAEGDLQVLRRIAEDIPEWHAEVLSCASPEEAVGVLARHTVHVVLVDSSRERSRALDAVRLLRGYGECIPVIVLTEHDDPSHTGVFAAAGAVDCLGWEEFTRPCLRRSVEGALAQRRFRQEKALLEEELRQSVKMESIGQLAGGLAHDFNNMLASIMGCLEMAALKVRESEAQLDLELAQTSCRRMAELTQQLLSFSRRGHSEFSVVDVTHILRETETVLAHSVSKSIRIEVDTPHEALAIRGNGSMLQQVLLNLGINAAEAMPNGGVLTLRAFRAVGGHGDTAKEPQVVLEIRDTGTGMEPEVAARAFEPFFTTKNRQEQRGTGLGLAIVRQNVHSHGGVIAVESEPGQGTTFRVSFPLEANVGEASHSPELTTFSRGSGTVLVVDDEDTIRTVAAQMLRRVGYTVRTATNGEEALRICLETGETIDAALLDLSMPVMGGEECMAKILERFPDIRVVLASGYDLSGEAPALMARGARGVIQKPFRLADLTQRISEAIAAPALSAESDTSRRPRCQSAV